ncbi:MAG: hypothetical protein ABUL64_00585, partial [Singulisphaera sp.]
PAAVPPMAPRDLPSWQALRQEWLTRLRAESFSAWPQDSGPLDAQETSDNSGAVATKTIDFTSEPGLRLRITVASGESASATAPVVLHVIGDDRQTYVGRSAQEVPSGEIWASFAPRGCDRNWSEENENVRTNFPRRFVLVGTTLDEGRVWDIRCAVTALRASLSQERRIVLAARGQAAGLALYAALFTPEVSELLLDDLPASHRAGPTFINVLRVLDIPQALALALPIPVSVHTRDAASFAWASEVAKLYPGEKLRFVKASPDPEAGQKP